jgi:hypothetical protein
MTDPVYELDKKVLEYTAAIFSKRIKDEFNQLFTALAGHKLDRLAILETQATTFRDLGNFALGIADAAEKQRRSEKKLREIEESIRLRRAQ